MVLFWAHFDVYYCSLSSKSVSIAVSIIQYLCTACECISFNFHTQSSTLPTHTWAHTHTHHNKLFITYARTQTLDSTECARIQNFPENALSFFISINLFRMGSFVMRAQNYNALTCSAHWSKQYCTFSEIYLHINMNDTLNWNGMELAWVGFDSICHNNCLYFLSFSADVYLDVCVSADVLLFQLIFSGKLMWIYTNTLEMENWTRNNSKSSFHRYRINDTHWESNLEFSIAFFFSRRHSNDSHISGDDSSQTLFHFHSLSLQFLRCNFFSLLLFCASHLIFSIL